MTEIYEIKLKIKEESELYNSFDEERKTLSSDVIDYLYSRFQERDLGEKMILHIISDEEIDMENLYSAFKIYLERQQKKLKKEKRKNMMKQIWMFAIGVLFISVNLYASNKLPALSGEIISTIGAFSLWEAANIWIVENPGNRLSRRWLNIISKTEIKTEIRKQSE